MHSLIILEPQYIFRKGLCHLFDQQDTFLLVDELHDFKSVERSITTIQPKIVIIGDYSNQKELDQFIQTVTQQSPTTEFMVITSELDYNKINSALESGVKSILTRNCSKEEIFTALNSLAGGKKFLCNKILDVILTKNQNNKTSSKSSILSVREQEVLTLIASGKSTQQISDILHISVHTTNTHRKNILKKLGINSPVELIVYAINNGYDKKSNR